MSSPIPWAGTTLEVALEKVEAVARAHGFGAKRRSTFAESDCDAAEARLGFPLPRDLRTFLCWFDSELWSFFVNPDRARVSDLAPIMTPKGEMITPGHPADIVSDMTRIHEPKDLEGGPLRGLAESWFSIHMFVSNIEKLSRDARWRDCRVIVFGSSLWFEPLVYCVDEIDAAAGSIVTFGETTEDRVWLASSLAEWLARLAACDGTELVFAPADLPRMPDGLQSSYLAELAPRNRRSCLFGQSDP